ncbi:MAG TPA: DsrE family protein [Rhodocyclaceae bacterium]|nr:DsrE family protein [Rhodocyclaceae bacterium]HNE15737.1 DsrE family protein [Rhodocyclaceae bacterium]HNF61322.1 DsrE family protein [Rhodocyclaceae bacterium]
MQKILIIVHAPPYGSERCLSALRLAIALAGSDAQPKVELFLMSDATVMALPHQQDANGSGLQGMVEELVRNGVTIRLCRTCALARGLGDLPLIPGTTIGTLPELAQATLDADKVITF